MTTPTLISRIGMDPVERVRRGVLPPAPAASLSVMHGHDLLERPIEEGDGL